MSRNVHRYDRDVPGYPDRVVHDYGRHTEPVPAKKPTKKPTSPAPAAATDEE